ncbi:GntR family transcriptional regulator [Streptomyces sp. SM12]|uniref:GntR family transcriptional regulator n=1 Tax=Streptomyces sp. SM12 TaxID=1071602 RepID=UPI000CD5B3E5|nr:GntR family transcriptional regulator [Streptomyces sp. SM12]
MSRQSEIADLIRQKIQSGQLPPGAQVGPLRDLAGEYEVSQETVRRAIGWLAEAGHVRVSHRGTFVTDTPPTGSDADDRLRLWEQTGSTIGLAEYAQGLQCQRVPAPAHVREIHELAHGERPLRRRYLIVAADEDRPTALVTEWWAPEIVGAVPGLDDARLKAGEVLTLVKAATGREPRSGRDACRARDAYPHESTALRIRDGAAVLACAWDWSDDVGLLVYGEMTLLADVEVGHSYKR